MIIQIEFPIQGERIPVDHSYALAGAIKSGQYLTRDDYQHTMMSQIIGSRTFDPGLVAVNKGSRLRFRGPEVVIKKLVKLSGKTLDLNGNRITVKAPEFWGLAPVKELRSGVVIIKGSITPEEIESKVREHLDRIGSRADIEIGRQKAKRIKGRLQRGREVVLRGLEPRASISIMETGIGGRTSFGAGWFDPI